MNDEHFRKLLLGPAGWNRWRADNPATPMDLSGLQWWDLPRDLKDRLPEYDLAAVDLTDSRLPGAALREARLTGMLASRTDFEGALLSRANLTGACLAEASFYRAEAEEATFVNAQLGRCNFSGASLRGADFAQCRLHGAIFADCRLDGCNFAQAWFGRTVFADVNMGHAQGLEECHHPSPSSFDPDTLLASRRGVPRIFWERAGVSLALVDYIDSFKQQPVELYSCFISHSSEDALFCRELHLNLRDAGVRAWYFPEDAGWGKPVWGEIDRSIRLYDKLLLVASRSSLNSKPVLRELERALVREDTEGRNVVFPLAIDRYLFDGWAHERRADVLEKVVADFTEWRMSESRYRDSLQRLVSALKRDAEG